MKLLTMILSALAMFTSINAFAGSDFEKYDIDGNGVISVEEASKDSALAEQFNQLDTDANGELSKEEFANFSGK